MINVPSVPVVPRHARNELGFDVLLELRGVAPQKLRRAPRLACQPSLQSFVESRAKPVLDAVSRIVTPSVVVHLALIGANARKVFGLGAVGFHVGFPLGRGALLFVIGPHHLFNPFRRVISLAPVLHLGFVNSPSLYYFGQPLSICANVSRSVARTSIVSDCATRPARCFGN